MLNHVATFSFAALVVIAPAPHPIIYNTITLEALKTDGHVVCDGRCSASGGALLDFMTRWLLRWSSRARGWNCCSTSQGPNSGAVVQCDIDILVWLWYDLVCYEMIVYDMLWYDLIWYNIIWYNMISYATVWQYTSQRRGDFAFVFC